MSDTPKSEQDLQALAVLIRDLTVRVYRIERILNLEYRRLAEAPAGRAAEVTPIPLAPPKAEQGEKSVPTIPAWEAPPPTKSGLAPNLESRIGSHWLNRIGIAAVLIGVSYFLKYAFDNNWIGPAGRVTIGLLAGIAVVVWSERFRHRGYQTFSYSLKAVGIGALYLSLWAAFQVYSLIPAAVAFVAMLLVTSSTAALALGQNAEILAAFSLIGGFLTPLLLSTGQNRERQLFSYVGLLDFAMLVLIIFKPWRRLLLLSFTGTWLLYLGWYSSFYSRSQLRLTLGFATLFFAIFAIAPLVACSRDDSKSRVSLAVPHFIAFLNAALYFLAAYVMLEEVNKTTTAWFALAMAAVYVFLSRQVQAAHPGVTGVQTLDFLHLALAIGFITIAIPIRLDAHWITIGWFVEAGVLLWVADRVHSDFLNVFAVGTLILGVLRLLWIDNFNAERLIFNARMATYVVAIAVLAMLAWYGSRREDARGQIAAHWAIVALNLLALVALSREVADYYSRQIVAAGRMPRQWTPGQATTARAIQIVRDFTYSALWMGYGTMLMIVGFARRSAFVRWQAMVLIALTIIKVFTYDVAQLDRGYRIVSFIVLGALLLAISFVYQRDWLKLSRGKAAAQESES